MSETIVGLDIGGANVKLATENRCESHPFQLWKHPERLAEFLGGLVGEDVETLAVTMTGELADGYATKRLGVSEIVGAVEQVRPGAIYYQTDGRFVDARAAIENWTRTAAANWHAMATWAAARARVTDGVVIDVGSTTTDIVVVRDSLPLVSSQTDLDRLKSGSLIYTGVRRSSVSGMVRRLILDEQPVNLANELFATIEDVYVVLGKLPERDETDTADGRPQRMNHAKQRISRMVCSDVEELGDEQLMNLARQISETQFQWLAEGVTSILNANPEVPGVAVVCGEGAWLAAEVLSSLQRIRFIDLSKQVSQEVASCAPAVAVRELARDWACAKFESSK